MAFQDETVPDFGDGEDAVGGGGGVDGVGDGDVDGVHCGLVLWVEGMCG